MSEQASSGGGVLVDPEPDAVRVWLDAVEAGLVELGEDPSDEVLQPWQYTGRALLAEVRLVQRQVSSAQARWLALLAEVEHRQAAVAQAALPTATWLTEQNTHSARTARDQVRLATRLARWPRVGSALGSGAMSVEQASAVVHGLDRLPDELDPVERDRVAAELVELAGRFGPYGLARLVNRVVEVVAPQVGEDADRRAVERVDAEQRQGRFVSWRRGLDGDVWFSGKLDKVAGQKLIGTLQAVAAQQRKAAALAGMVVSRRQANADALGAVLDHFHSCGQAPRHGADRPRILVTVDYDTLAGRLGTGVLLNTGDKLSAAEVRRLACDAQILPAVMAGRSVPLDVGRAKRLFTGHLRALLIARDQGCAFPGCDRPPAECEGHHRRPWWDGGRTSLRNGVLVCTFHHHLVEADPNAPPGTQWSIRLDADGHPEFGTPEGVGAPPGQRRWRQHQRYRTR